MTNHRAEIPGLELLAIGIFWPRGIAHVQLVGVCEGDIDTSLRKFSEELPGDRGLPDPRRTAEPQDGNWPVSHPIAARPAANNYPATIVAMIEIMAAILRDDVSAGQVIFWDLGAGRAERLGPMAYFGRADSFWRPASAGKSTVALDLGQAMNCAVLGVDQA